MLRSKRMKPINLNFIDIPDIVKLAQRNVYIFRKVVECFHKDSVGKLVKGVDGEGKMSLDEGNSR